MGSWTEHVRAKARRWQETWADNPADPRHLAGIDFSPVPISEDASATLNIAEELRARGYFVRIILRPDCHKSEHKYLCEIEPRGVESAGGLFAGYGANGDSVQEVLSKALEWADVTLKRP